MITLLVSLKSLEAYRFVAVGAAGFVIDALVLTILLKEGQSVLISRTCSFTCASLMTWWLHRAFTFKRRDSEHQAKGAQYLRYITVQILGASANLAIFSALVAVVPRLLKWAVIPLAIGAAAGLAVNYFGSSRWAFRKPEHE